MGMNSAEIRSLALAKLLRPDGPSVATVSEQLGVPVHRLYYWLRLARNGTMKNRRTKTSEIQDKLQKVLHARSLQNEELGHWLREQGLHEAQIDAWEKEVQEKLAQIDAAHGRESEQAAQIKELERDLRRKERALAEFTTLMALKKKHGLKWLGEE